MDAVTVSPKFQVVIPRRVREALGLAAGDKMQVVQYEGRIEFIPVRSAKKLRSSLRGDRNDFAREPDRL